MPDPTQPQVSVTEVQKDVNKIRSDMEVLKHGKTMLRAKCKECDCEFLYQETDIKTEETRINAYESEIDYHYIKCPECSSVIKVEKC